MNEPTIVIRGMVMNYDEALGCLRTHQCLAEMGYVNPFYVSLNIETRRPMIHGDVPLAIAYMALKLAFPNDDQVACWSCYVTQDYDTIALCYFGKCVNPDGPKLPPRELMVSRKVSQ